MSHSLANSGRVDFGNLLVMGMDPNAIALRSEMHPVSARRKGRREMGVGVVVWWAA